MLDEILQQRGAEYGPFESHAATTWRLYQRAGDFSRREPWERSAAFMICFKLTRAIQGDHTKVDTWLDIAGYARLAADLAQDPEHASEFYDNERLGLPAPYARAAGSVLGGLWAIGRGINAWAGIERAAMGVVNAKA